MNELIYRLEVITPLFMGGAEARLKPELRPPSIRGALRYWYRALIGGALPATDLRVEEASLFGSTKEGSSVKLVVHPVGEPKIGTFKKDGAIRTREGNFLPSGKDYLLWSMGESGRQGTPRHLAAREFIEPGSVYTLHARSHLKIDLLEKVSTAIWLLGNLGSLGSRSRRGAGSIDLVLQTSASQPAFQGPAPRACATFNELKSYLEAGLRTCRNILAGDNSSWNTFSGQLPDYDILAPNAANIWIVAADQKGWSGYKEALTGLGERFRDFRSHSNPSGIGKTDHDAVLDWVTTSGPAPDIQRSVFGLPLPFRYSDGGPGDVIISTDSDRRSSPLHMRVTRLSTGRYVGVLTLFQSAFLDPGGKQQLKLQTRGWEAPPPPDFQVIHDFVNTYPIHTEVNYA